MWMHRYMPWFAARGYACVRVDMRGSGDSEGLMPDMYSRDELEDALAVLEVLAVREPRVASNWSRRFKNHQEKLRSGDLFAQAEVVRNLALRQEHKRLGPAESTMLRHARQGVVAELAVSL